MNVHTALRMVAGYNPAKWVQIRLSMMDTVLPWRDPDAVFVSATDVNGLISTTVNYNGAGGVNDGFNEMVAWKTADMGAVIPARTGENFDTSHYCEQVCIFDAYPADAANWQPVTGLGVVYNSLGTHTIGTGICATTAAAGQAVAINDGSDNGTVAAAGRNGSFGGIWPTAPMTGASFVSSYAGNVVAAAAGTNWNQTTAAFVSNEGAFVLGVGNNVNNPAAGNRTVAVRYYTRVFDLPTLSSAPWVDGTGWNVVSPADFGDPAVPASDPNGLLSSFGVGALPQWQPTIDDTGLAGPFDGLNEGVRWQAATPAGFPVGTAAGPFWTSIAIDNAPAYVRSFGIGLGWYDVAGSVGITSGYVAPDPANTRDQWIDATNNGPSINFGAYPANANGVSGFFWPLQDATTKAIGRVNGNRQLDALFRSESQSSFGTSLTYPADADIRICTTAIKDTAVVGAGSAAFQYRMWWTAPTGYVWSWPE